jgi:hypothetical protein
MTEIRVILSPSLLARAALYNGIAPMASSVFYLLAADLVLLTHVLFVVFVVLGLLLVLAGKLLGWQWVCNPWFRLAHLLAIAVVVAQSWLGLVCPLTTLEMALRSRTGEVTYEGAFIAHWLQTVLYYQAPVWVFALAYTAFGGLVLVSWIWVRPRPFR